MKRKIAEVFKIRPVSVLALVFLCVFVAPAAWVSAAGFPKPVKACGLLTAAEVESLIGGSVGQPREMHREFKSRGNWMSTCNYYSEAGNISIGITLTPMESGLSGERAYALHESGMKKSLGADYRLELVAGIGEKAGWDGKTRQLTLFRKPFQIIVTVTGSKIGQKSALELGKKISGKMLARLPAK